ncbi:hypothetical protein H6G64_28480 [Calothrix sp. FACHB-156]|nr:hypothetical protein [Calothrix sp. FACHB-156]
MTKSKALYILSDKSKRNLSAFNSPLKKYKLLVRISFVFLSLGLVNVTPSLIANAATANKAQAKKVICQSKKLGYEEALFFYLAKPQQEFESAGVINLYEDARLEVLAKGIENWLYVKVIDSESPKDKFLEGWVSSAALKCNAKIAEVKPAMCEVTGLVKGQLSLRRTPGGKVEAGLDNGNNVTLLMHDISNLNATPTSWIKVRVIPESNPKLANKEGWINSDYVMCYSNQSNDAINFP